MSSGVKGLKFVSIVVVIFSLLTTCKDSKTKNGSDKDIENKNIVDVISNGMDFQLPKKIKSGWTTFRYINNSAEVQFFILEKMPDTIRINDYKRDVIPPFMDAFDQFDKGDFEAGMKEFGKIPAWFSQVELAGGVGLTSPKQISQSTFFLIPGVYILNCYVRMPSGRPHTLMGMIEELVVEEDKNEQRRPKPDLEISVSSENGVSFVDSLKAGNYTLSVDFKDQKLYESMLGHDINLVKLEYPGLLEILGSWINSGDLRAFRTPAPAGMIFLGGVEDLTAATQGYFEVSLDPGNYVLISEVPKAIERKMFYEFKVY